MCDITPREALRLSIKDKLKVLQKKEPVLAALFQQFLDLDEEAQKLSFTPHYVPINPFPPAYQPTPWWQTNIPQYSYQWWNNNPYYKLTLTCDTSTGSSGEEVPLPE